MSITPLWVFHDRAQAHQGALIELKMHLYKTRKKIM